jgi:hypothetical protein
LAPGLSFAVSEGRLDLRNVHIMKAKPIDAVRDQKETTQETHECPAYRSEIGTTVEVVPERGKFWYGTRG